MFVCVCLCMCLCVYVCVCVDQSSSCVRGWGVSLRSGPTVLMILCRLPQLPNDDNTQHAVRDSQVNNTKENFNWDWDLIGSILKVVVNVFVVAVAAVICVCVLSFLFVCLFVCIHAHVLRLVGMLFGIVFNLCEI